MCIVFPRSMGMMDKVMQPVAHKITLFPVPKQFYRRPIAEDTDAVAVQAAYAFCSRVH